MPRQISKEELRELKRSGAIQGDIDLSPKKEPESKEVVEKRNNTQALEKMAEAMLVSSREMGTAMMSVMKAMAMTLREERQVEVVKEKKRWKLTVNRKNRLIETVDVEEL